jgi:hypothetical protein
VFPEAANDARNSNLKKLLGHEIWAITMTGTRICVFCPGSSSSAAPHGLGAGL